MKLSSAPPQHRFAPGLGAQPKARRSSIRKWWLLGALLLFGSLLGAHWALNGTLFAGISFSGEQQQEKTPRSAVQVVSALGFVDVETGVVSLFPAQQGRIVEVVREGTTVKKGDVLLVLDKRVAQFQFDAAKADRDAAEALVKKAESAAAQQENLVKQQEVAINVAKHKKTVAEEQRKKLEAVQEGTENDRTILREQEKIAAESVKAEELKLAALNLAAADLKSEIERAKANVDSKEAQLNKAQYALDESTLRAPSDGLVLRVTVSVGEWFGTSATQPAITFCPDTPRIVRAEVLQEWASLVKVGQTACIKDDTHETDPQWAGVVKSTSEWIAPKRQKILEPFMINDVRTMECIIQLAPNTPVRIGQRVRVKIDVGK